MGRVERKQVAAAAVSREAWVLELSATVPRVGLVGARSPSGQRDPGAET